VTSDVWVNYTVFALTSTYRIISIERQLRVEETAQDATPTSVPASSTSAKPPSALNALSHSSSTKAPAFATLLVEPYSTPRAPPTLKLPKLPVTQIGIDEITTGEQLAQVARALEMLMAQRTAIQPIRYSIQARLELMAKEYPRQRAFSAHMLGTLYKLARERQPEIEGRLQALVVRQEEILARIDRVLQRLMDSYSKELTEYEVKWFKELARMRKEVSGTKEVAGTNDGRSLKARALLAQEQLEMLRPALMRLQEEEEHKKRDPESNQTLGTRQTLDIGKRLGTE
jgi:nucleoporin NUP82